MRFGSKDHVDPWKGFKQRKNKGKFEVQKKHWVRRYYLSTIRKASLKQHWQRCGENTVLSHTARGINGKPFWREVWQCGKRWGDGTPSAWSYLFGTFWPDKNAGVRNLGKETVTGSWEPILFPITVQRHHVSSLKLAMVGYLHHKKQQMLQNKTPPPPPNP